MRLTTLFAPLSTRLLFTATLGLSFGCASSEHTGHWGYTGEEGPEYWALLSPDYAQCSAGKEQSPIDIRGSYTGAALERLVTTYEAGGDKVTNNGHTLQVGFAPGSTLSYGGTTYTLLQFHAHSPSEHQINGVSYPMELHLVHKSAEGKLAVVGVLLAAGAENKVVTQLLGAAPRGVGEAALPVKINAADLLPQDAGYFTYPGSLTTPPCGEGVRWIVMKEPASVSWQQVDQFLGFVEMNARPVQPLNSRRVENFAPLP